MDKLKQMVLDFFYGKIRPGKIIWVDDQFSSGYVGPAKVKYYHVSHCIIGVTIPVEINTEYRKDRDIEVWDSNIKFI